MLIIKANIRCVLQGAQHCVECLCINTLSPFFLTATLAHASNLQIRKLTDRLLAMGLAVMAQVVVISANRHCPVAAHNNPFPLGQRKGEGEVIDI